MCVYMCIYIYIYIHVYIHTYIYMYISQGNSTDLKHTLPSQNKTAKQQVGRPPEAFLRGSSVNIELKDTEKISMAPAQGCHAQIEKCRQLTWAAAPEARTS